jgi:hypothetical protein
MGAEINFDANTVPPRVTPPPVPAGDYRSHIIASGTKKTKDGKGTYLELEFEVLDGEFKGRKFWDRLNLVSPSQKAAEIAQRTLSAICYAVGVLKLTNSSQLHHSPLIARLTIRQDPGYDPANEVKAYKADPSNPKAIKPPKTGNTANGATQAANVVPSSPAAAQPVQQAANVPPWAQKKSA